MRECFAQWGWWVLGIARCWRAIPSVPECWHPGMLDLLACWPSGATLWHKAQAGGGASDSERNHQA